MVSESGYSRQNWVSPYTWSGATRFASSAGWNFSPLDDELGLVAGSLTPLLAEHVAFLGMELPFEAARSMAERCFRVALSERTVRRRTYSAGEAALAAEEAVVEQLEKSLERPTEVRRERQQVSADGAMIRTRGGEWKEVRTLVIGTVTASKEGPRISAQSYHARLCDHDAFIKGCRGEFFRRATENVRDVEAVMDGADWLSQLVDEHCPNALRILDFTHAAGAVIEAAHAVFGQGTEACAAWLGPQLHELRNGKPEKVLDALISLAANETPDAQIAETVLGRHNYLARRIDQIQYDTFAADGYSIGSGMVESANKHLVQARLKGAGMQWAPASINPILALRCAERSHRWQTTWSAISPRLRRKHRHAPVPPVLEAAPLPQPPTPLVSSYKPTIVDGRPTPEHPWKGNYPPSRAKL